MNPIFKAAEIVETITPTRAETWLQNTVKNRRLSEERIVRYAKMMVQKEWKVNGESIKFNDANELLDGQHRLHACVRSGAEFRSYVVRGLSNEIFDTLDTGKGRTNADILSIEGAKNAVVLAASIRWVRNLDLIYRGANPNFVRTSKSSVVTPQIARQFLNENPQIEDSVRVGLLCKHLVSAPIAAALHFMFSKINGDQANIFFDQFRDGRDLAGDNPIFLLREFAIKNRSKAFGEQTIQVAARMIRAWNLYRRGIGSKMLKGILERPNGELVFPEIE